MTELITKIRQATRKVVASARGMLLGAPSGDGFGQTMAEDALFLLRFRQCRRLSVEWRQPSQEECHGLDGHAIIGRFGDDTIAVAQVGNQNWIVRDRTWHGWPDPPEFVFFVLEDDKIWAAADFHNWPRAWRRQNWQTSP